MTEARFTDIAIERNDDGIYDIVIDGDRDLATVSGFETAIMCSLFSDRRAANDEVADPLKRRGWIGNLVSDTPGDNYGSGIWLYEQRRGTSEVIAAVSDEARQSLDWMVSGRMVRSIDAQASYDPAKRSMMLLMQAIDPLGGVSRKSFDLWRNTGTKTVTNR